jgi:hypothetical protein
MRTAERFASAQFAARLVRGTRAQSDDLVLDLQFSLLEAADRIVVGMRPGVLVVDRLLKGSVLGLERFDVVHCAHGRPPGLLRTSDSDSDIGMSHAESTIFHRL